MQQRTATMAAKLHELSSLPLMVLTSWCPNTLACSTLLACHVRYTLVHLGVGLQCS